MTVTVKQLIPPKYVPSTDTIEYTAVNCKTLVDNFTVTNVSANNATFSMNLVPGGDAVGTENLIIKARTLAPNETYTFPELIGQVLEGGYAISILSGTASALVISVAGREITS